jgi:copper homeostasis protein
MRAVGAERGVAVMAGAGLTPANLREFVLRTGIPEVHLGSAVRQGGSFGGSVDSQLVSLAKRELLAAVEALRKAGGYE